MKTPTLSISLLLLLSLLHSQAQGIRLDKGFISARKQNNNIHEDETGVTKTSSNAAGSEDISTLINSCKDGGECSSSGSTRKLISMTSSTTTTTVSKNEKNNGRNHRADPAPKGKKVKTQVVLGGEDGNAKAKSSSSVVSKHPEAVHQHYPDLADITEMDYSPARRKPPIHN